MYKQTQQQQQSVFKQYAHARAQFIARAQNACNAHAFYSCYYSAQKFNLLKLTNAQLAALISPSARVSNVRLLRYAINSNYCYYSATLVQYKRNKQHVRTQITMHVYYTAYEGLCAEFV